VIISFTLSLSRVDDKDDGPREVGQLCGGKWVSFRTESTPLLGTANIVSWEADYESLTDYETAWEKWRGTPEAIEFAAKFHQIVEGFTTLMWRKVE